MILDEILSCFNDVKKKDGGKRYEARCPAHDDKHPSLSIYINGDWVNLHCFTGCSEEKILSSVGLKKSDLFIGAKGVRPMVIKEKIYKYQKADGTLAYTKKRLDYDDGKKSFFFSMPDGTKGLKDTKHLFYNLPGIDKAKIIYFAEGEKCADAIIEQGYTATTLDSGANSKFYKEYIKYFKDKEVIIIPDNDEPGMKYAKMIQKNLPWAVIKELPGLKEKEDVYDWLQSGHSITEIEKIPATVLENTDNETSDISFENRQQSGILLDIIRNEETDFFMDESNNAFIEILNEDHKEIYDISGSDFNLWAQNVFYKKSKKAICKDSLARAIDILIADTKFGNKQKYILSNRVAKSGNDFWFDLSNDKWSAIRTNSDGWALIKDVPKLFCRYNHQAAQTLPQSGGNIMEIFKYVNMSGYQTLFLCWLVSCYVPDIPHPMPIFYGEKGAAKSTACELLKKLIDPSLMDTVSLSKDERTLVVNLQHHYFLPFDNVSAINNDTSDILCRAITGGAVQQRKLHTNGEDYIFKFKRCLAINGINNVANRSDLLDRSILFELERVPEEKRKEVQEIKNTFEADRPYLLGAIFDILSKAMAIHPTVKLDMLPRMADFCRWGYAIAEAIGNHGDRFLQEYKSNQEIQNTEAVNADMVAFLIVEFMRHQRDWSGRVSKLYSELKNEAERQGINPNSKNIPQSPNNLSRRIKAVKSNLEKVGITFEFDTTRSDGTYIILKNTILSPLASCHVNPYQVLEDSSEIGNGDGNGDSSFTSEASPLQTTFNSNDNGDNEDDEDENVIF